LTEPLIKLEDLPSNLQDHARAFYAAGAEPATPKLAATVLLVRPVDGGYEVYAVRRVPTMPFAPGMYAFPGGTVDPRDIGADVRWTGPSPAAWAERLGQPEPLARAVVCAAVREVFEETGVLLASVDGSVDYEDERSALVDRRLGFADFLASHELALCTELLAPWSRWITPEFEPRRYDTYFFLARLPERQMTRNVGGEADVETWLRPSRRHDLPMLPPTRITLSQVSSYDTVDDLVAASAQRDAAYPVVPRLELPGE
jgi:8-oxo-dGTP pyrophosphatase MutT (NUDIX family)